ncbi:unnamed protein product [Linum trigynum]|uniref:Retrotransposon Copia-like N-terminal domain-containing protein n=1 Tax=Linum trigynum TaxID=586398 RepID=A0AAV2G8J5_9ROSI
MSEKEYEILNISAKSGASPSGVTQLPSPFIIHQSDSPNKLFVGDLLTEANYGEWVGDITDSFIVENKLGFVDGSISAPTDGGAAYDAWKQVNAMVKGWLKTAMPKDVHSRVRFSITAREMWVNIQSSFGHGSTSRMYELKCTINLLQ